MRPIFILAAAAAIAAAGPALAQPWILDKIEIKGVKSVSVDELRAALPAKTGDKVTVADLTANQDALGAALTKHNVVGAIQTAMRNKNNGHIDAIFTVKDDGIQKPVTTTVTRMVNPKLAHETFAGNKLMSSDDLAAAAAMNPGDELTKDSLNAAGQRIQAAYKKGLDRARKEGNIGIQAIPTDTSTPGQVDIQWKITETDIKKKKSGDDSGYGAE